MTRGAGQDKWIIETGMEGNTKTAPKHLSRREKKKE